MTTLGAPKPPERANGAPDGMLSMPHAGARSTPRDGDLSSMPRDPGLAASTDAAGCTLPLVCSHSIGRRLSNKLAVLTMVVMALLFASAWWSVRTMLVAKNAQDVAYHAQVVADIITLEARNGGEAAVRARVAADAPMRMNSRLELWYADGTTCFADGLDGARALSEHVQSADLDVPAPGLPGELLKIRYTKDFARDDAMGKRWAWIMALMTLGAGAAVALGTRWRVRQMLRPLNDLAAQTRAISPDRLDQRLELADPAEELLPWINQFNALMSRLERAYAQLEAFNADVAHELRTPLATLRMQTELALARERPAEELRDTLACSLEELQRMSALVNDMLFLSQADRGAKARRGEPQSLADVARSVAEFHEGAADERGLRIEVVGDAMLAVDEPLIQRALSNLLGNACRFATQGSVITVRLEARDGGGGARVSVHNRGDVIAPDELPRLFTRFFRGDASRCCDGDEQHFGLGLAIVAAIARMHGGAPFADSGARGTTIGFDVAAA
jgi:two-component system heavy metal sensor histidine kinase CusS